MEINIDWKEREYQLQKRIRSYFRALTIIQRTEGEPTKKMVDEFVKYERLLKASCDFRSNFRMPRQ